MEKTKKNESIIEGELTRDPEIYYTANGSAVCKFDIAVDFKVKSGEKVTEDVSFISVVTWNKVAESCQSYLKKGAKIRVRGRLKNDTWTAKDGSKRSKVYIEAMAVDFLHSGREG